MDFDDLEEVKQTKAGSNILLVDALNLAFRYKHKKTRNFGSDYVRTITSLAQSYRCDKILVHADQGQSTYRLGVSSDYKGNRKEMRAKQTEEEAEDFKLFLQDFNEALELCKTMFTVVQFQGVEADDTIAYVALNAKVDAVWIISTDKDLDQMITDRVNRFSYVTRKEVTEKNFYETYGCTVEQYISIKVLQGDSGDNVPGVPLVGPKRSVAIVREYGSALDLYDQLPITGKQKFVENINAFGDQILTNYELMDLPSYCEEAVGEDNIRELENIMEDEGICTTL